MLTTAANALMGPLHDRMPVMIRPADYNAWLDPAVEDVGPLRRLFEPYADDALEAYAVSVNVNRPSFDRAECIERTQRQQELF